MSRYKVLDITRYWDDEFFVAGQKKEIVIRKLNYGEMTKIQKDVSNVKITGTITTSTPDIEIMKNRLVLSGIKSAPILITELGKEISFVAGDANYIANLPALLGDFLYNEIEEWNTPSKKE